MNGTLKVDSAKLRATADQFSQTSSQIKSATSSMVQTVGQLSGSVWSGDAATSYINKFNGLNDEIEKIDKMIQEHVTDLNNMATEYESTEDAIQQNNSTLNNTLPF